MKLVILVVLLSLPLRIFAGGIDIGNGGDIIKCKPGIENDLFGFYSLDYLVFDGREDTEIEDVSSWEQSLFRIRQQLVEKVPELLTSFDEFSYDILNTDYSRKHVWESTDYELIELDDEDLPVSIHLPDNCRKDGKIQLIQAVIRQNKDFSGSDNIFFKYMPEVFDSLESQNPLQLSFLLVHEWLWSVSDNVDRNRRINWYFHSVYFEEGSSEDVRAHLEAIGLDLAAQPIIVSKNANGHFSSLQQAIMEAPAGATIHLYPGTYTTSGTVINKALTIIGIGDATEIIVAGSNNFPALEINAAEDDYIVIQNISFVRSFFNRKVDINTTVLVSGGFVEFDSNIFGDDKDELNSTRELLYAMSENTYLILKNNYFSITSYTINFFDSARGEFHANIYSDKFYDHEPNGYYKDIIFIETYPTPDREDFIFNNTMPLYIGISKNKNSDFCSEEERVDKNSCVL